MRLDPGSRSRAQAIVDDWNSGDVARLLARCAEDVRLTAIAPKTSPVRASAEIDGRAALAARLTDVGRAPPRFDLLSLLEADGTISLVLRDGDGDSLTVAVTLNAEGKIVRIVSFRPK